MITLRDDGIYWEREDVRMMARIIGSEHAVIAAKHTHGHAPPLMSILKLAKKYGMLMSEKAEQALANEIAMRKDLRANYKNLEDAERLSEKHAAKYFAHQRGDLLRMYRYKLTGWLAAHEPGVGKTLLAIRYAHFVRANRKMVICPNAAKDQWADEIRRWSDTRDVSITVISGTVAQQSEQIRNAKGWCIGHWESLVHAREAWLSQYWDFCCLDEAQYMQNRNAQRTETVFKLRAVWRIALTAHPYANGVNEIFPILKFLYPNIYTSFWRWANLHIEIDEGAFGGLDLRSPRRPNLLKWELEPFMMRRLWESVWKNLPPITRVVRTVELSAKGRREYEKLKKQFFVELKSHGDEKNILAIPSVLARVTRLRQYLIDPGILDAKEASVKYPAVYDLIKELKGRPPVIFTMYREAAKRLCEYLRKKKLKVEMIVGGMQDGIGRIKKKFLRGQYDAVIVLIQVGSTALNFGKYGAVIYLDHPWTQKDVEQSEGRVHRPEEGTGKIAPTTSYHIVVKDSYEERMAQHRRDKHKDFKQVFTTATAHWLFDGKEPSIELGEYSRDKAKGN
jgi:SNF2 family DNA or RNA helicase